MCAVIALLIGSLAGLQDAQEPSAAPQAPREVPIDGVFAVVNHEIITLSELEFETARRARETVVRSPEEWEYLSKGVLNDLSLELVKMQAGQDMGFDPAMVSASQKRLFDDRIERLGGPIEASKYYRERGQRPEDDQEMLSRRLFANSWESAVIGRSPGATGRVSVDRYVRPGQIYSTYQLLARSSDPRERERVGATPEQIEMQQLVLPVDDNGGEEATLSLAAGLRRELVKGADFTELARTWGAAAEDGRLEPIAISRIRRVSEDRHRSDALDRFVQSAQVGDLSEPLVGWAPTTNRMAIWIYLIKEKIAAGEPGSHLDLRIQSRLEDQLIDQLDGLRRDIALRRLLRSAYIWPPELRPAN